MCLVWQVNEKCMALRNMRVGMDLVMDGVEIVLGKEYEMLTTVVKANTEQVLYYAHLPAHTNHFRPEHVACMTCCIWMRGFAEDTHRLADVHCVMKPYSKVCHQFVSLTCHGCVYLCIIVVTYRIISSVILTYFHLVSTLL